MTLVGAMYVGAEGVKSGTASSLFLEQQHTLSRSQPGAYTIKIFELVNMGTEW